jgi:hypothetical protein
MTSPVTDVTVLRRTTALSPAQDCACGQPLDCCHTTHCPRCGITLRAA